MNDRFLPSPRLVIAASVFILSAFCSLASAQQAPTGAQAPPIPLLSPSQPTAAGPPVGSGTSLSPAARKAADQWGVAVRLHKAKHYQEAIAAYNSYIQTVRGANLASAALTPAYQNLTALYRAEGKVPELIGAINSWSTLAPTDANLHAELGSIYASAKVQRFDDAAKEARRALSLKPSKSVSAACHATLGIVAIAKKQFQEAEQEFALSTRLLPSNTLMLYNYGLALVERKKYGEALTIMRRATVVDPKMTGAWYVAAKVKA